jgi:hypothetical protein
MSHHAIVEDRWEAARMAASALVWWCQLMHDCGSIVVSHSTVHAPVRERCSALVWVWRVAGADVNACPLELG